MWITILSVIFIIYVCICMIIFPYILYKDYEDPIFKYERDPSVILFLGFVCGCYFFLYGGFNMRLFFIPDEWGYISGDEFNSIKDILVNIMSIGSLIAL